MGLHRQLMGGYLQRGQRFHLSERGTMKLYAIIRVKY